MGTEALAFATFLIILQVVPGAPSGYPLESQNQQRTGGETFNRATTNKDYRMQPPMVTRKDALSETNVEDKNANGGVQSTDLSGSGKLETNEIVKYPNASPKAALSSGSLSVNNNEKTIPENKQQTQTAKDKYNFPELDKAVETAVSNLPSSDAHSLVPLIQFLKQKLQENSNNDNLNSEENEEKKFLQKHIILKLAKSVQKQNEALENNNGILNPAEQVMNIQQDGNKLVPESKNKEDDNEPCECENGCEEDAKPEDTLYPTMPEKEEPTEGQQNISENYDCGETTSPTPLQENKSGEDNSLANNNHVKILARIRIIFKIPEEDLKSFPLTSLHSSPNQQLSKPTEFPPMRDIIQRMMTTPTPMPIQIVQRSLFDKNEQNLTNDESMVDECDHSDGGETNTDSNKPFLGNVEDGDSGRLSSFPRFQFNGPDLNFGILNNPQIPQFLPKELIIPRVLSNIMKQKAAVNSFREPEIQQMGPFPSFEELPNIPSLPMPRLVMIRPNNGPRDELPPIRFADEASGFNAKNLEDSRELPIFTDNQDLMEDGSEPLNNTPYDTDSEESQVNRPEDIPLLIKRIISNLSNQQGPDLQLPTPSPTFETPAEGNPPVFLRAFLAPISP